MVVIGFLLVLVAAGAIAFVLMAPAAMSQAVELTAGGVTVNATPLASFIAGAVSVALIGLGFPMITKGLHHKAKTRKELHQLRKEQATAGPSTATTAGPSTAKTAGPSTATSADASTSTASGEHSTRRDNPQAGGSTYTSNPGT
jgi:hypothetical protein